MKAVLGLNLPEITEVTLLSSDELSACEAFIPEFPDHEPGYYYLRTAYEDNQIGQACGDCEMDPTDPDFEDYPPEGSWGTALRPVLKLASATLKDGTALEAGDSVLIGDLLFTAISETILMAHTAAWYDRGNDTYGYFDDETNVYENSLAKKRVDTWFEEKIKPCL